MFLRLLGPWSSQRVSVLDLRMHNLQGGRFSTTSANCDLLILCCSLVCIEQGLCSQQRESLSHPH